MSESTLSGVDHLYAKQNNLRDLMASSESQESLSPLIKNETCPNLPTLLGAALPGKIGSKTRVFGIVSAFSRDFLFRKQRYYATQTKGYYSCVPGPGACSELSHDFVSRCLQKIMAAHRNGLRSWFWDFSVSCFTLKPIKLL